MSTIKPTKDAQTVTSRWESVQTPIHGFVIKGLPPNEDERSELCEIYRIDWGMHPEPMVQAYQAMVRPKKVKGWVLHQNRMTAYSPARARCGGPCLTIAPIRPPTRNCTFLRSVTGVGRSFSYRVAYITLSRMSAKWMPILSICRHGLMIIKTPINSDTG